MPPYMPSSMPRSESSPHPHPHPRNDDPAGHKMPSTSAKSRPSRSRSSDDRLKGSETKTRKSIKESRRSGTGTGAGELHSQPKYPLKVKTQYESLKRSGLCRSRVNAKKKVDFAFLEVREFPMILGDNPSCSDGPPVTIDWAHDPKTQFILDVNTFERMRGNRRVNKQLIIPRTIREKCLAKSGFSHQEVIAAMRQLRKDKHSRMVSSQQVGMDNIHEATEKVTSGFKKIFAFKKSQYDKTLENACTAVPTSSR